MPKNTIPSLTRPHALALVTCLAALVSACSPSETQDTEAVDNVFVGEVTEPAETAVEPIAPPPNVLEFTSTGSGSEFLADGWSTPEESFTWTTGTTSQLVIPEGTLSEVLSAGEGEGSWNLNLRMWAFLAGAHTDQSVDLFANGDLLSTFDFSLESGGANQQLYTVDLGDAWTPDSPLALTLEIDDPQSPAELEVSPDERALGVALASISFDWMASE